MYQYNEAIQKMINFDDVTKENIKEQSKLATNSWSFIQNILIIVGSGSGKTNSLFHLINWQPDIEKIYL